MKSINKYFNQTIDNCCNLTEEEADLYGLNNNQSKTKQRIYCVTTSK